MGQSEAGTGKPELADALVAKVERREAPRPTSLGARGWRYQLRKAEPLFRLEGASQASWRLPPLHPAGAGSLAEEFLAKLGRIRAARTRKLGCLTFEFENWQPQHLLRHPAKAGTHTPCRQ